MPFHPSSNSVANDNKENRVSIMPSTPLTSTGPLKPSHFTNQQSKNKSRKSVSPSKRLPFASKNNNVSVTKNLFNNIVKSRNQGNNNNNNNNSTNNNNIPFNSITRNNTNNNNNNNTNNARRLQKYGSVLGLHHGSSKLNVVLPRTKSLVLKDEDIYSEGESSSEEEEDDDVDDENNLLRLKLRNAWTNSKTLEAKEESQTPIINEIEYKSVPMTDIPYVSDGYTPFTQSDITKLQEFHTRDIFNSEEEHVYDSTVTVLPLETINNKSSGGSDIDDDKMKHSMINTNANQSLSLLTGQEYRNNTEPELLPLETICNGNGLDDDDITDLLNDL